MQSFVMLVWFGSPEHIFHGMAGDDWMPDAFFFFSTRAQLYGVSRAPAQLATTMRIWMYYFYMQVESSSFSPPRAPVTRKLEPQNNGSQDPRTQQQQRRRHGTRGGREEADQGEERKEAARQGITERTLVPMAITNPR